MRRASRKQVKAGGDQPAAFAEIPTRIFLYLQPKSIFYPIEDEDVTVEIELEHPQIIITMLNDHYTPRNIIYLDEFKTETPTFSVTIKQDDIEDVTSVSDTPLTVTLYENIAQPLVRERESPASLEMLTKENEESLEEEQLVIIERSPVAQGYIDLMEFFARQRSRSSCTTFLYPLPSSRHHLTCKIEWEIYSLHPLVKNLIFSNVVFLTLGALYNLEEQLMDDCDDMMIRVSFISTMPNENNQHDKVFLCSFKGFSKQLIGDQVLNIKWENLKNMRVDNQQSMGIMTESKVNIHKLFQDLLCTDTVEFNLEDIDISTDTSLICNSLHRYILSDDMEKILEATLTANQQRLLIEVIRERKPYVVMLQGFVDLAVFLYPEVANCSFAIEMRPPGYKKPTLPTPKDGLPKSNKKGKRKDSASTVETLRSAVPQEVAKEKIPFATLKICLSKPITDPLQNMIHIPKSEIKYQQFNQCPRKRQPKLMNHNDVCEESYRGFDESIETIVDYMIRKNIKTIEDDRQFYCSQLGNMTNKIIRLVACDFNDRITTQTNTEFTNLMTLVYQELIQRIYGILMKCSFTDIENCISRTDSNRLRIIDRLKIIKYMFEVGNLEIFNFFMHKLSEEYANSPILDFYLFLYNVEREDFKAAELYLQKPLIEKDIEGELFIDIVKIYIKYKQELSDSKQSQYAVENLIRSLTQSSLDNPEEISTWILLYCIYKRHNYLPGMEYCRWKYENLYRNTLMEMPFIPKSRWDIYMAHKLEFKSQKGHNFYQVVNLFLSLGLYQIAEWIFDEIASEAMEVEKYFMSSTFKIFLNKLELKFTVKNFPVEKYLKPFYLRATLSQVNGNLEYLRNSSSDASMKHYSLICDIKDLDNHDHFHLGLYRYSYRMMEDKEYAKAKVAFSVCCSDDGNCFVAAIGKGKACYRLEDLDEAEHAFAQSTRYGVYMPNVWAYLALINLRKGENYKALECWKYARLNPNDDIHPEILHELSKINYSDVNLYIDIPARKTN